VFGVTCLGFRDECFVLTVHDVGCRIMGYGLRAWDQLTRAKGLGFRI
jgi:hypothetical protein